MSKWYCPKCGFMYNEETGNEKLGIPPNTPFEKVDPAFVCPLCRTPKALFFQVG
jgi:rubredoxin